MSILFLRARNKTTLPRGHSTASSPEIQDRCDYTLAGLEVSQSFLGSSPIPLFSGRGSNYHTDLEVYPACNGIIDLFHAVGREEHDPLVIL